MDKMDNYIMEYERANVFEGLERDLTDFYKSKTVFDGVFVLGAISVLFRMDIINFYMYDSIYNEVRTLIRWDS